MRCLLAIVLNFDRRFTFHLNRSIFFLDCIGMKKKIICMQIGWCFDQMWFNVCIWLKAQKCTPNPSQLKLFIHRLCFPLVLKSKVWSEARITHFFRFVICIWQRLLWPRCCLLLLLLSCEPFYEFSASFYSLFYVSVWVLCFRVWLGGFMFFLYVILSQ